MARWHKETKYRCKHKGFIFEFDTAAELGKMVAESGCPMSNPYDPDSTDYDDFAEAFYAVRESNDCTGCLNCTECYDCDNCADYVECND